MMRKLEFDKHQPGSFNFFVVRHSLATWEIRDNTSITLVGQLSSQNSVPSNFSSKRLPNDDGDDDDADDDDNGGDSDASDDSDEGHETRNQFRQDQMQSSSSHLATHHAPHVQDS